VKLRWRLTAIAAALVVTAAVVTISAVFTYRHAPGPPASTPPPTTLAAEFTQLENRDWQEGPAWSTIKVPLVIAAYRQGNPPHVTGMMKAAITESDNAAAESLWAQLGDPPAAAQRVQQILRETGDPTSIESRRLRAEFTAFGQTIWSLTNQTRFITGAFCNGASDPIFQLMSQVAANQTCALMSAFSRLGGRLERTLKAACHD
jgi:hypothetical protein